jgi:hypothetical protein
MLRAILATRDDEGPDPAGCPPRGERIPPRRLRPPTDVAADGCPAGARIPGLAAFSTLPGDGPRPVRLAADPAGRRFRPCDPPRRSGSPPGRMTSRPHGRPTSRDTRIRSDDVAAFGPAPWPRAFRSRDLLREPRCLVRSPRPVLWTARSEAECTGGPWGGQLDVPAGHAAYLQVTARGERVTKGRTRGGWSERAGQAARPATSRR